MRHDSSSLPHAINRVGERAAHGRTVRLPKTFLAGASGSPDTQGKQFSFTFSHGDLADGNSTVPALHFGVDKLQAALRAAIDAASGGPAIQAPGASFNATFNELEMAVWPAPSDPTPLVLTSADYTTLLQILLKDTEENPGYHTLYSGLIKDPDGVQPNGYVVPQSNDVYMIANFGVYYYTSSTVQPARDECINTEDASDAGPGGGQATGQGGSGSNGASTMGNAGDTQSAGSFPNQAAHPPPAGGGCGAGPRVDPTLDETWGRGARWPWRTTPRPRACAFWQTCITIFKRGQ
ncbi:MAG: hypothetical protein M1838_002356 [Thelocarpon superellum]|nr:MAG: hypothetical protein M1838_002356 [Thelocarpon superellum]